MEGMIEIPLPQLPGLGGSQGVLRTERIQNPSRKLWVWPEVTFQSDMPRKIEGNTKKAFWSDAWTTICVHTQRQHSPSLSQKAKKNTDKLNTSSICFKSGHGVRLLRYAAAAPSNITQPDTLNYSFQRRLYFEDAWYSLEVSLKRRSNNRQKEAFIDPLLYSKNGH